MVQLINFLLTSAFYYKNGALVCLQWEKNALSITLGYIQLKLNYFIVIFIDKDRTT